MHSWFVRLTRAAAGVAALVLVANSLAAQGVTSAAVTGVVSQANGAPIEGAVVEVLNPGTGQRLQAVTRATGRYTLENVPPGGPYTISARAIGYQAASQSGIRLALGQRHVQDFSLTQSVVELEELTVAAAVNPLINTGRTGAAQSISQTAIENLPLLGRNFTDLVVTAPQVAATANGGPSIGGQNNRLNNIQIDGAVNNDLFGLGSTGVPGGQVDAKAISLEAVQEFQVLVAPYDVRQGSFSGGLVNAITRSGSNQFRGSVFGYLQGDAFVGDLDGVESGEFSTKQYGATLSGPILRDRLHYFVAADIQSSTSPFVGATVDELGESGTGVGGVEACERLVDAVGALGYDAGSCGGFTFESPNPTVFAKLDWQPGLNSRLTVSYNFVDATGDRLSRRDNGDWQLTGGAYQIQNSSNSLRANWAAVLGNRFSNDLIVGYQRIRDNRPPNSPFPTVRVEQGAGVLVTGAERFSQANSLDQDIVEVTDNLTFDVGQRHQLTLGTHNEFFKFRNTFLDRSIGEWTFDSIEEFEAGTPAEYARQLELRPNGGTAEFSVNQFGVYAQDRIRVTDRLTVTAGVRLDVPMFPDKPVTNDSLLNQSALGINTGNFPSGNALWSPRVGVNLDVFGDGRTSVRGGVGLFTGRPAYVWVSNAFGNTGTEKATLTCSADDGDLPAFTLDPAAQYDSCLGGGGPSQAIAEIHYFDEDFKFQQNLKAAFGVDQELPWNMVGTFDFVYTKWTNAMYIDDANLTGPVGTAAGEGGRVLYGTIAPTGSATPARVDPAYNQALLHTNQSEDRSYQATFQLQKRFSDHLEFNGGYTYSNSKDLMSFTSSTALSNFGFVTLDGPLANRNLTTSAFDRPHKVTLSGTVQLPAQFALSLIYTGISGTPYAYMIQGDANADGIGGGRQRNDLFYVPRNAGDITLEDPLAYGDLEAFINEESCLATQRGRIMERNSCRNPWINLLNARLAWHTPSFFRGQSLELSMDIFNLLNLVNSDWGEVRQTSEFEGIELVRMVGYDQANQRGVYRLIPPVRERLQNATRWRMQWGAKLSW